MITSHSGLLFWATLYSATVPHINQLYLFTFFYLHNLVELEFICSCIKMNLVCVVHVKRVRKYRDEQITFDKI